MVDLKNKDWTLVPKTTTVPGEVRPDERENDARREANDTLLRGNQASLGDVPQPGQKTPPLPAKPAGFPNMPARTLANNAPVKTRVESGKAPQAQPQAETSTTGYSKVGAQNEPDTAQLAQKLKVLTGGGEHAKLATPAPQTPVTPPAANTAAAALQVAFQKALNKLPPGPQKSVTTGKDEKGKLADKGAPQPQVADGSTDAEGKIRQPKDPAGAAEVTRTIVQGNPFAAEPPAARAERRKETKEEIKSDRSASERLASITEGVPRPIVAVGEKFSEGSYHPGTFGDQYAEFPGLAGKNGPIASCVYGEDYVQTQALGMRIAALSNVISGGVPVKERILVSIDKRVDNTAYISLPERMTGASEADAEHVSLGYRTGLYGGIIG